MNPAPLILTYKDLTNEDLLFWHGHQWRVMMVNEVSIMLRDEYNHKYCITLTSEEFEGSGIERYVDQEINLIKVGDEDGRPEHQEGSSAGELPRAAPPDWLPGQVA